MLADVSQCPFVKRDGGVEPLDPSIAVCRLNLFGSGYHAPSISGGSWKWPCIRKMGKEGTVR